MTDQTPAELAARALKATVSSLAAEFEVVEKVLDAAKANIGDRLVTANLQADAVIAAVSSAPGPEPEPIDPLARGLLWIFHDKTAVETFPAGAFLPVRTLAMVARFNSNATRYEKLAGAASTTAAQGAWCVGRTPNGSLEAWAVGGSAFKQAFTPITPRKASLIVLRLGADSISIRVDGGPAEIVTYPGALAPADGPAALLAGYWGHRQADPADAVIRVASAWDWMLSDADIVSLIAKWGDLIDAEPAPPAPEPPSNGGGTPAPGDPAPDVPPPGGPGFMVSPENAAMLLPTVPERADIILAAGDYLGLMLQPKAGQRWRFVSGVRLLGNGRKHFLYGAAKDVALLGEPVITGYQPSPAGKKANGRANDETSIIEPAYDVATGWTIRGPIFRDNGKGCLTVTSHYDVRDIVLELVEGAAISGRGNNMHIEGIRAKDINTRLKVASAHHAGVIKLLGGERRVHGAPPRADILIKDVRAENVVSSYGAVWLDWAIARATIQDLHVNGCDYGAFVIEASAYCKVLGGSLRDGNRTNHHNAPIEWGGAAFLQNSHDCLVDGFDFHLTNHARCAVAVMHHDRRGADGSPLHGDTQPDSLVGKFTGTNNVIQNCGFGGKGVPQLYVGCVEGWAGTCASVRASNKVVGVRSL